MSKYIPLPQISVATPCHENWDEMDGSEQSRHCAMCEKSVFNLSEMTSSEVREVIGSGDSVCVRMRKRADGSIVTKDAPRLSLFARVGAVATSVLATMTLAGCTRNAVPECTPAPPAQPNATAHMLGEAVAQPLEIEMMGDMCVEEVAPPKEAPAEEIHHPMIQGKVRVTPPGE